MPTPESTAHRNFGDYIVYVDESGDHSLTRINPEYPLFILAFCIFRIEDYINDIVPNIQRLKFKYFGHDSVILHENDMRKSKPPFDILQNSETREMFFDDLNTIMAETQFGIIPVAIKKYAVRSQKGVAASPYHIALEIGLKHISAELQKKSQSDRTIFLIFESRGKKEDETLETEFHKLLNKTTIRGMQETLKILIVSKQRNSTGLQIADMVARPIGLKVLKPQQPNRSWEILQAHIISAEQGNPKGTGVNIYP